MIKPTVGRVVLFHPNSGYPHVAAPSNGDPVPALIVRIWGDRMVNLGGFDANDAPFGATSVTLCHDDAEIGHAKSEGRAYACWMPYQLGQAAKTEALEARIKEL